MAGFETTGIIQGPVLVLSPHADDAELAMGGTISRLSGKDIPVTILTFCTDKQIAVSTKYAAQALGAEHIVWSIKDLTFHMHRSDVYQAIRTALMGRDYRTIFAPSRYDLHDDHRVVFDVAQVFAWEKGRSLICWAHSNRQILAKRNLFIRLDEKNVDEKHRALSVYEISESYGGYDYVRAALRYFGPAVGGEYAEGFFVEWIRA